jgi:hypothetical protein
MSDSPLTETPLTDTPRFRITSTIWLCGLGILFLVWVALGLLGWPNGRSWEVARDPWVLGLFLVLAVAWTGVWLTYMRNNPPPFSFA